MINNQGMKLRRGNVTKIKGYISDSRLLYLGPPLLFAIYAVLALLASNIYELQWTEVFRPPHYPPHR
jgi:hypothetical protein